MLRTLLHSCRGAAAAVLSVVLLAGPGAVHGAETEYGEANSHIQKACTKIPTPTKSRQLNPRL